MYGHRVIGLILIFLILSVQVSYGIDPSNSYNTNKKQITMDTVQERIDTLHVSDKAALNYIPDTYYVHKDETVSPIDVLDWYQYRITVAMCSVNSEVGGYVMSYIVGLWNDCPIRFLDGYVGPVQYNNPVIQQWQAKITLLMNKFLEPVSQEMRANQGHYEGITEETMNQVITLSNNGKTERITIREFLENIEGWSFSGFGKVKLANGKIIKMENFIDLFKTPEGGDRFGLVYKAKLEEFNQGNHIMDVDITADRLIDYTDPRMRILEGNLEGGISDLDLVSTMDYMIQTDPDTGLRFAAEQYVDPDTGLVGWRKITAEEFRTAAEKVRVTADSKYLDARNQQRRNSESWTSTRDTSTLIMEFVAPMISLVILTVCLITVTCVLALMNTKW